MKKISLVFLFFLIFKTNSFCQFIQVSDLSIVQIFVKAMQAEDFVRGYYKNKEVVINDAPYMPMHPSINTKAKLQTYLASVYTKEMIQKYIDNLDIIVINKKNNNIGRMALKFYTKFYDFNIDNKKAILIKDLGDEKIYKIIAKMTEYDKMDTLDNFRVKKENGIWKVNVIPDDMRGLENK